MNLEEMLLLLREGRIKVWNGFRKNNPNWIPDLTGQKLPFEFCKDINDIYDDYENPPLNRSKAFDMRGAILFGADLSEACLIFHYKDELLRKQYAFLKMSGAKYDKDTKFPSAFDPAETDMEFTTHATREVITRTKQTRVFISYAWANEQVILAIDQWLRTKNIQTVMDRRDFFAGTRLRDEITKNMAECGVILVFYSEIAKDKPWTIFERELAADLEMDSKTKGELPPRIIYCVIDNTPLPTISEKNRLSIQAKGKRFELVCEELYHHILSLPRKPKEQDLKKWQDYTF